MPDPLVPCSAYIAIIRPADLSCGGCRYCTRADAQWAKFTDDVDGAIRLTVQARKTINRVVYHKEVTAEMTDKSILEGVSSVKDTDPARDLLEYTDVGLLDHISAETDVGLLDHIPEATEINFLDIVLSVDTVCLQGSESQFDIVTKGPDEESHIHKCFVMTQDDTSNPSCWGFTRQNLQEEHVKTRT